MTNTLIIYNCLHTGNGCEVLPQFFALPMHRSTTNHPGAFHLRESGYSFEGFEAQRSTLANLVSAPLTRFARFFLSTFQLIRDTLTTKKCRNPHFGRRRSRSMRNERSVTEGIVYHDRHYLVHYH